MTTEAVLEIILAGLNHLSELQTLYSKAKAENRDLTADEIAQFRGKAVAANDALRAAIDAASKGNP